MLTVPLVALVPCDAYLIWTLGFAQHPHHAATAFIVGAITPAWIGGSLWWAYRQRIKRIRKW